MPFMLSQEWYACLKWAWQPVPCRRCTKILSRCASSTACWPCAQLCKTAGFRLKLAPSCTFPRFVLVFPFSPNTVGVLNSLLRCVGWCPAGLCVLSLSSISLVSGAMSQDVWFGKKPSDFRNQSSRAFVFVSGRFFSHYIKRNVRSEPRSFKKLELLSTFEISASTYFPKQGGQNKNLCGRLGAKTQRWKQLKKDQFETSKPCRLGFFSAQAVYTCSHRMTCFSFRSGYGPLVMILDGKWCPRCNTKSWLYHHWIFRLNPFDISWKKSTGNMWHSNFSMKKVDLLTWFCPISSHPRTWTSCRPSFPHRRVQRPPPLQRLEWSGTY